MPKTHPRIKNPTFFFFNATTATIIPPTTEEKRQMYSIFSLAFLTRTNQVKMTNIIPNPNIKARMEITNLIALYPKKQK